MHLNVVIIVKIILKSFSKSQRKNFKLEDYKKCLEGETYQEECENYILRSVNHEMYLPKVKNLHYLFSMKNDVI